MDTALAATIITAVAGIIVALIAWHSSTTNARISLRNAAQDTARRIREDADASLEAARQATEDERQRLLELLHTRLEEYANQLGSARQSLARARKENAALRSDNEELRTQLRGEHHGQEGMTT